MSCVVGLLIGALLAAMACGAYAWSSGWRPLPDPPKTPRKALLLSAEGVVHSTRTITGFPPPTISARAGTYRLDRSAISDHYIYRQSL